MAEHAALHHGKVSRTVVFPVVQPLYDSQKNRSVPRASAAACHLNPPASSCAQSLPATPVGGLVVAGNTAGAITRPSWGGGDGHRHSDESGPASETHPLTGRVSRPWRLRGINPYFRFRLGRHSSTTPASVRWRGSRRRFLSAKLSVFVAPPRKRSIS